MIIWQRTYLETILTIGDSETIPLTMTRRDPGRYAGGDTKRARQGRGPDSALDSHEILMKAGITFAASQTPHSSFSALLARNPCGWFGYGTAPRPSWRLGRRT